MHGTFRFFLATLVMLSHLWFAGPVHIGVASVAVFYMLAGYVVAGLCHRHFPPGRLLAFYAERLLRIFPLYFFFLVTVALWVFATGFGPPVTGIYKAFAHLTIIPLNYDMFSHTGVVRGFAVLPTSWSLAVELQAYAILPLIIRSLQAKWIVGAASLLVFSAASFDLIDSGSWGYRLLPGVFFLFLIGSAMYKSIKSQETADSFDRKFPAICWGWSLILILMLVLLRKALPTFPTPVMMGLLLGMPVIRFTSTASMRNAFDSVLGRLSYGLFLLHFPAAWLFEHLFGRPVAGIADLLFVMGVSLALAAFGTFTIERWTWPLRKSLASPRPHGAADVVT